MKKFHCRPFLISPAGKYCFIFLLLFSQRITAQTWTAKADFINGQSDYESVFTINDTIYVSNPGSTGFFKYDYTTNTWSTKANMPAALSNRYGGTGFAVNGKGYMIGGFVVGGACAKDVWEYTPSSDTWVQKADFPGGKRMNARCFVIGDKAYVVGGIDTTDITALSITAPKNDFWQYDPATDTWTQKANIPYDSSYLEAPFAFSIGNKGYISCGQEFTLYGGSYYFEYQDSTFEYDTLLNTWTAMAIFPGERRSGGVSFVLNNIAYCGTGVDLRTGAVYACVNDFYTFNPVTNSWSALPATPFAARAYGMAATVSTGKAFFGTGWQQPSTTLFYKDWWEFTPAVAGINDTHNDDAAIKCYPNPCTTLLHVQVPCNNAAGYTYSLYSFLGQQLLADDLAADKVISTEVLPQGDFLLVISGNGHEYQQIISVLK